MTKNNRIPELLDEPPIIEYKEDAEPYTYIPNMPNSFVVTADNDGNLYLQEKGVFKQFDDYTTTFNSSAQRQENYYGMEFKTPAYPTSFLTFLSRNNWVYRQCAERVSNDCVKNGFDIVSRTGVEDVEDIEAKQEVLDFFNRMPVPITKTLKNTIYGYELVGNTGIEIIRENGLDSGLQHLEVFDVTHVKLCTDNQRIVQTVNGEDTFFIIYGKNYDEQGNKLYLHRYTGEWSKTPLPADEEAHEVIWIYRYDIGANEYGVPLIATGLRTLEMERGRENYIIDFFVNFGMPAWIVSITGQFYDEESRRYKEDGSLNPDFDVTKTIRYKIGQQIQEIIDGGRHGAIVMSYPTSMGQDPVKVEVTPLATDVKEASFRGLREDNNTDLCGMMGIDPNLIVKSETGAMGNNAVDSLLLQHNDNKIKPTQNVIVNEINHMLLLENESTFVNDISNVKFKLLDFIEQNITESVQRDADLVLKGLMKAREFQNKYSKALGISSDDEEELLDTYCINGVPITVLAEKGNSNIRILEQQVLKAGAEIDRKQRNFLQAQKRADKGLLFNIKKTITGRNNS